MIRIFTVCYSIIMILIKYPNLRPLCLNFRKITAKFSGVQKFRNFTVAKGIDTTALVIALFLANVFFSSNKHFFLSNNLAQITDIFHI